MRLVASRTASLLSSVTIIGADMRRARLSVLTARRTRSRFQSKNVNQPVTPPPAMLARPSVVVRPVAERGVIVPPPPASANA